MIDVIVPIYNVECYLKRCVESILSQTYSFFNLILVEDGSPDNCGVMCDEYTKKDQRIIVLHKENGGLSSARNAGLKVSTAEYVTFVDSDDWLSPFFLETLLNTAISDSSDIVESAYFWAHDSSENKRESKGTTLKMNREQAMKRLFRCEGEPVTYYAWGRLYKRSAIENIIFPEGKLFEDLYFNYFVLKNVNVVTVISTPLYFYFINPIGITRGYFTLQNMQILDIWNTISNDCIQNVPEMYEYANINYERAFLGLLAKCCRFGMDPAIVNKKEIKDYLQNQVQKYRRDLMNCKMPINRKILTLILSVNYQIVEFIVKVLKCIHII